MIDPPIAPVDQVTEYSVRYIDLGPPAEPDPESRKQFQALVDELWTRPGTMFFWGRRRIPRWLYRVLRFLAPWRLGALAVLFGAADSE